jgi:hypothetical protein
MKDRVTKTKEEREQLLTPAQFEVAGKKDMGARHHRGLMA